MAARRNDPATQSAVPTDVPKLDARADSTCRTTDTIVYPRYTSDDGVGPIISWFEDHGLTKASYTQVRAGNFKDEKGYQGFTAFFFVPSLPDALLEELLKLESVCCVRL